MLRAGVDDGGPVTPLLLRRLELNLFDAGLPPLEITGLGSFATPTTPVQILAASDDPVSALRSKLLAGDRTCLVPLVCLLVSEGRPDMAEACLEGRGMRLPATRRDLGIALTWYGRHDLFTILSSLPAIPPDLAGDDYGQSLAAVVAAGWMSLAPDGRFLPDEFIGSADLERLVGRILTEGDIPEGRFVYTDEIDPFFGAGSSYAP